MKKILAGFVSYIFTASFAFAGDSGKVELFDIKMIEKIINSVFGKSTVDMFVSSALQISGGLNSMALGLAGILALISILWGLLFAILNRESVFAPTMETLIYSTLTVLLLANYQLIIQDVVNLGQKTLEATGGSVGQAFTGFIKEFVSAFSTLFKQAMSRFDLSWDFFKVALEVIISVVFLILAAAFVLVSLIELVVIFVTGPVGLGVGIAVGPLFIATLPWKETRGWLRKWLDFLIVSSMITAMAVIVMLLIQGVFVETVKLIAEPGEGGATIGRVVAFALICASLSKIFANIPAYADALFPGRSSALSSGGAAAKGGVDMVKSAATMGAGALTGATLGKALGAAAKAFQDGKNNGERDGNKNNQQNNRNAISQVSMSSNSGGGQGGGVFGGGGQAGTPGGGSGGGSGGSSGGGAAGNTPDGNGGGGGGVNNGAAGNTPDGLGGGSGGNEGVASAAKASQTTSADTQSPSGQSAARAVGNQESNKSQPQNSSSFSGKSRDNKNILGQKNGEGYSIASSFAKGFRYGRGGSGKDKN